MLAQVPTRLATRYLYVHHGNCEHWLYVTNIRLFNRRRDAPTADRYPLVGYRVKHNYRVCEGCKAWNATKVVFGDKLSRCSTAFYCEHCHHALHYRAPKPGSGGSSSSGSGASAAGFELVHDGFSVFPYLRDA
jgi:hypothetical protein